jgi:hypothetical protein
MVPAKKKTGQRPVLKRLNARKLSVSLHIENLTATIHAGFQVNVVRAAKLARGFVFDPGDRLHLLAGTAHADAAFGHFSAWNGHRNNSN